MSIRNSAVYGGSSGHPDRLRAVLATGMMREFTYDERKYYNVERDGVLEQNVTGDGSCLYYSLASLLAGRHVDVGSNPANATKLKAEIKDYISKNWDRMKKDHGIQGDRQEYLNAMEERWGGPVELDAAAELYDVIIFEWTSGSSIEVERAFLSDEQALKKAVLRARYYPHRDLTKDEFKQLRTWNVFLHNNHYRYLMKSKHTPNASNSEEQPKRPTWKDVQDYVKEKRSGPKTPASTMKEELRRAAQARQQRREGIVCVKDGLLPTEEMERMMLKSDEEIARRLDEEERRNEEDYLAALQLQYGED